MEPEEPRSQGKAMQVLTVSTLVWNALKQEKIETRE